MTLIALPSGADVAAELGTCEPGEAMALLIPYQRQDHRALAINHFDSIVRELRAAGWELRTGIDRFPDGEAYSIEPVARPTTNVQGGRIA